MPPGRFSVSLRSCLAAGVATEAAYLSLYLLQAGPASTLGFITVQAVVWAIYGIVVWTAVRTDIASGDSAPLWLIAGAGILFRLTLIPHAPIASDDVYRYIWDGRIALNGINPFAYAPSDPALSKFATDQLPALVNHPELKSVYPAVSQLLFLVSNLLFGPSVSGFKLILVTIDVISISLLAKAVRMLSLPLPIILLYAWSPLPILYGALDGHIDILGIPFLLLTLISWQESRRFRSGLALGAAALVKIHPLLAVPFLISRDRGWKGSWPAAVPVAVVALGLWAYDEPSHGFFDAMATMGKHWEFNGPFFTVVFSLVANNQTAHVICALALLIWVGWVAFRPAHLAEKFFWGFLGFVLLGPTAHPWYFLWVVALAALRWSPATLVLLALTNISNIVVYRYHNTGTWTDDPLLIAIEYGIPLIIALVVTFRRVGTRGKGALLKTQ